MKITTRCIPCLLERIRFQSELKNGTKSPEIMQACLDILSREYGPDRCSAEVATKVHRKSHEMLGFDPYFEIKEECNRVALSLVPRAWAFIEGRSDKLEAAIIVSIVGNVMDFGISDKWTSPRSLLDNFDVLINEGLGYNDIDKVRPYLQEGKSIIYMTDNCGEVVLDKLLLELLATRGCRVVLVVKGEPILTDATMKDVGELGLDKIVEKVLTTGTFAVGIDLENIPCELRREMENADIIVSKGMANFEALSERLPLPTAFMLRTKCLPVARALGLDIEINALKMVESQR